MSAEEERDRYKAALEDLLWRAELCIDMSATEVEDICREALTTDHIGASSDTPENPPQGQ